MTYEKAKAHYRTLVFQHHPDRGGDTRTMQNINAEWAKFQADYARNEAYRRQENAHAEGKKSAADYHDMNAVSELLRMKIEFALNLDGVDVELMGLWIWLTGNTKAHKEAIKANTANESIKWAWSPDKSAWYFASIPSMNRQRRTLDEIRDLHGSQRFTKSSREDEPARLQP